MSDENKWFKPQGGAAPQQENPDEKKPKTMLEAYREHGSELQDQVARKQAETYETAVRVLMSRTGDDTELVNAMNGFLNELLHNAVFGQTDEPLGKDHLRRLTEFFQEQQKAMWEQMGRKRL